MAGYVVGRWAARPLAARLFGEGDLARVHALAERVRPVALILSRPVPMLAEPMTVAAGVASMRSARFAAIMALAYLGVALVFAAIVAAAIREASGELMMIGAVGLPLAAWLAWLARRGETSR